MMGMKKPIAKATKKQTTKPVTPEESNGPVVRAMTDLERTRLLYLHERGLRLQQDHAQAARELPTFKAIVLHNQEVHAYHESITQNFAKEGFVVTNADLDQGVFTIVKKDDASS